MLRVPILNGPMRYASAIPTLSILLSIATVAAGADETAKATGRIAGRAVKFPQKTIADGVRVNVILLESSHDESAFDKAELAKAKRGDHIRLVLSKPRAATILGKPVTVSELLLRLPLNKGVYWVRSGTKWRRFAKYEFGKTGPVQAWLRTARFGK